MAARILKGRDITDGDLQRLQAEHAASIAGVSRAANRFDALVMPTVPIVAPPLAAFVHDAEYTRLNALVLRNPSLANFLDRCAISLPVHEPGEPPVGLMLVGHHGADDRLLALARAIERALSPRPV